MHTEPKPKTRHAVLNNNTSTKQKTLTDDNIIRLKPVATTFAVLSVDLISKNTRAHRPPKTGRALWHENVFVRAPVSDVFVWLFWCRWLRRHYPGKALLTCVHVCGCIMPNRFVERYPSAQLRTISGGLPNISVSGLMMGGWQLQKHR